MTRKTQDTRLQPLREAPQSVHIFHALRLLDAVHDDRPRLGESLRPRQDAVRLSQEAELAFPPSTIASFKDAGGAPAQLVNRFFGFFGPEGPLPLHLTEYARDRARNFNDPTFVAFANIFTHRLMSLFYRAWASAEPAPSFDRGEGAQFERRIAALTGLHGDAMQDRDAFPDLSKRHFAGLLSDGSKTADGLVAILSSFFGATIKVQQFVGCWLDLEREDRWQLGTRAGLGEMTTIGDRVWTRGAKFRIRVGPLSLKDYETLLPGAGSLIRFRDIVRTYAGIQLDWDLNLVLRAQEVPQAQLGAQSRLGQTSWIGTRDDARDADDLYLDVEALA